MEKKESSYHTCDLDAGVVNSDGVNAAADGYKADVVAVVAVRYNLGRHRATVQAYVHR